LGASVVAVVQYSSVAVYTPFLLISAGCFSVAIPILAIFVHTLTQLDEGETLPVTWWNEMVVLIGYFSALSGLAALFAHIQPWFGIVFILGPIPSYFLATRNVKPLIE
jgi:hypothetical protein